LKVVKKDLTMHPVHYQTWIWSIWKLDHRVTVDAFAILEIHTYMSAETLLKFQFIPLNW